MTQMPLELRGQSTRGKPRARQGVGEPPHSQMGWCARMTGCECERWDCGLPILLLELGLFCV